VVEVYPAQHFDFFILFNSFYPFQDKKALLDALAKVANPGALIVLFDYSVPTAQAHSKKEIKLVDFSGKDIWPMDVEHLKGDLNATGWTFLKAEDLTEQYIKWYKDLLKNLEAREDTSKGSFTPDTTQRVKDTFSALLERLHTHRMGGVVVYAQRESFKMRQIHK